MNPIEAGERLARARQGGPLVASHDILAADVDGAYAIQDATLARVGPVGGWKVGARGLEGEPRSAPLPASGVLPTGTVLRGPQWQWRGIEVEAGLRVGRDLDIAPGQVLTREEVIAAFDAVVPTLELIETRMSDRQGCDPLANLADLMSHGALIVGEPAALAPKDLDVRNITARLLFDGQVQVEKTGANPALDVWRPVVWLAHNCAQRGLPLRKGQIVTTGTCMGMLAAPVGVQVRGEVSGVGVVEVRYEP